MKDTRDVSNPPIGLPPYVEIAARFHAAILANGYTREYVWNPSTVAEYAFEHANTFFAELNRRTSHEPTDVVARLTEWSNLSDDALRLRCGEMTAQEIRTVRAVLRAIMGDES